MYTPKHLELWKSGGSYIGEDFSEYYCFVSKSDPDLTVLNESNFAVALEELGGESETVKTGCFKHFACGHFEQIFIHQSDEVALKKADELAERLKNYPVLDDDDYSERESESYSEAVESWGFAEACKILGIEGDNLKAENKSRIERACIDCFYYFGEEYIREDKLRESLAESKQIVPFSWVEYERSQGQLFFKLEGK